MENKHIEKLNRLINFVEFHQIEAKDIWEYEEKISLTQFLNKIENLTGKNMSVEESSLILELSKNEDQSLQIKHFQPLGLWVGQQHLVREVKSKAEQKVRPKTSKKKQNKSGSTLKKSKQYYPQIVQLNEQNEDVFQSQLGIDYQNFSHKKTSSLLHSASRLEKNENELQMQIMQNSLDKKWDYLLKVGQINNWIKSQSNVMNKNIFTSNIDSQDGDAIKSIPEQPDFFKVCGDEHEIIIINKDQNGEEQILPLKVFDQKYQSYKKKFADEEKFKNNMKGTMMMVLDEGKQRFCKSKLVQKISQRDQQLNYLLLEIIRVKNMMEQQEKILTECGINA